MFRVGQKVVCVDAGPSTVDGVVMLSKGAVYTITGFDTSGKGGLLLSEVPHHRFYCNGTPAGWWHWRFRPVTERKTDTGMAILREILERESHQDRAPARAEHSSDKP